MSSDKYCAVCEEDASTNPAMVLARWQDQDICTDCLENRPGKDEAEAEARGERRLLTQEEYRSNDRSDGCPRCQSTDYTPGTPVAEVGCEMEQDRWCNVCEFGWTAVYRIAGYVRHSHGDEDTAALQDVWCVDLSTDKHQP